MDTKTQARVPIAAVAGLISDAMAKCGLPPADAAKVAELMLEADLSGADAHGVFRLPQYVDRLKRGSTNPRPNIKVEQTAPATALVFGDNGMGHLVVAKAAETAVALARESGVAWVGVRMSGHAGAAGVYASLPVKADMIGLYAAVANANHMPLAGGAEPLLGTNPLAIGIPAGQEPPLVLDIATSIVSYGTIKNHRLQNIPLAPDWMVDPKTGEAVVDPQKSALALLLPMAGVQGRRTGADARPARRHPQRRAVRPRLRRFQRRAGPGDQYRPVRRRARSGALPAARDVQGGGRPPHPRTAFVEDAAGRARPAARRGARSAAGGSAA